MNCLIKRKIFLLILIILSLSKILSAQEDFFYYPKAGALESGDTLFVMEIGGMNEAERLLVSTMMGILAKEKPRIYINLGGSYAQWLDDLTQNYGITVERAYSYDVWGLFDHLKSNLISREYILCDLNDNSLNVANTLAGIWNTVAIDFTIETQLQQRGFTLKSDLRGKDESWCFANYWGDVDHNLILQQKEELPALRDYAVLAQSFIFYDGNSAFMRQVMDSATADAAMLGWGDASQGEDKFIQPASKSSVFTVPADHAWNLSVFSGIEKDSLKQQTHGADRDSLGNVHTVTFIMSDGDNIQWLLNTFSTAEQWYASPLRGEFNMGWTISPSMIDLAPSVMSWIYKNAKKDCFVSGVSGGGYMYPADFPALNTHTSRLNDYFKRCDLSIVTILEHERGNFTNSVLNHFTQNPQIDGCFYLDYAQYDYYGGQILWSNGKPVVSAKFNLWEGFDTPQYIANLINISSRNLGNAAAYSFINVHPWSKSLADVKAVIDLFNKDVEVVTPEIFIKRMRKNVPHDGTTIENTSPHKMPKKPDIKIYPNPARQSSTFKDSLLKIKMDRIPESVKIINTLGQTVSQWNRPRLALHWNGKNRNGRSVPSGIYFIRVNFGTNIEMRKFILLK